MPVSSTTPAPTVSEFGPLRRNVQQLGLLERRGRSYAAGIGFNLLLIAGLIAAMVGTGNSWLQLLLAVPAGVLTTRTAFIGHDAGHQQIGTTRRANRLLGLIHGNLMIGLSYSWWTHKHNRHHANPNHVEKDPDVGTGALVWTPEQARSRKSGWGRRIAAHQAKFFFPLLLLEGLNLKVASALHVWRGRLRTEAALLFTHYAGYVTFLLLIMSPGHAAAFFLVHQAILGIHLGCAFAPNHKGMPMPGPEEKWDHLHRQVLTSRNVRGGPITDWLLGGLNYQIEHHLFPNMPRMNLRRAQPVIRRYCTGIGLPYTETGLLESYRDALRHLSRVGS
ncbi:MAG TPA: acyl-CoA desaturase [Mycobacteriales bacterium]|nr:acyl-CoA desaturase [Mycobacteriales bacterium]